ncbi:DUF389 domain-containing protein [uncultured Kordia sp.]|uniref:DUF389 domain-containing protein n=1 Tax=uncultured Kordia sp. TaxID=507699 RepID=UPI002611400C|nr:DUF389 domain-containing protein [uncultured Kordia sp.]
MSTEEENKFSFSEDEPKITEETMPPADAKGLWEGLKIFMNELLDIQKDTDKDQTIAAIKADIPFKGATAWILIFAVFVASIGLNVSSTAVVIGAMLISPLMGPILGIGMSLAINDIDTLRSSFTNLLVMVILSIITAYLYFVLSPLTELTPELESRTEPNILDVFVAIFGGLALIVARTKKGTIASVIFGVAIATALMPPLCTAGYGLAVGNFKFFLGAMYLFAINTTFIALATFLVLKVLRFPMLKYANSAKRKRISRLASLVAFAVMIPAVWTFWNVLQISNIKRDYGTFIENIQANPEIWLQERKKDLDIENRKINLNFIGEVTPALEAAYQNDLKNYEHIKDFKLKVNGNKNRSFDKISNALDRAYEDIDEKQIVIEGLQKQIVELKQEVTNLNSQLESKASSENENYVAFSKVAKDAKILHTDLRQFGFAKMLSSNDFIKVDTIPVAAVKWNPALTDSVQALREKELEAWLRTELSLDTLIIERIK